MCYNGGEKEKEKMYMDLSTAKGRRNARVRNVNSAIDKLYTVNSETGERVWKEVTRNNKKRRRVDKRLRS